jgi:hypothetical protein
MLSRAEFHSAAFKVRRQKGQHSALCAEQIVGYWKARGKKVDAHVLAERPDEIRSNLVNGLPRT